MSRCGNWLEDFDQLSSPVTLSYKKKESHGTVLGGCISLGANVLVLTYVLIQIYSLIDSPGYSMTIKEDYQRVKAYSPEMKAKEYG